MFQNRSNMSFFMELFWFDCIKLHQHKGLKLKAMHFFGINLASSFWTTSRLKWAQNEVFLPITKFNAWNFPELLVNVTGTWKLKIKQNFFPGKTFFEGFNPKGTQNTSKMRCFKFCKKSMDSYFLFLLGNYISIEY